MSDSNTQPIALQPPDIAFEIRPVAITGLYYLHQHFWQERTLEQCKMYLMRIIRAGQRGDGRGIVALDASKPIAYGQILRLTKVYEISDLFVQPDYRSQGIGTAMIQSLCRETRETSPLPVEIGAAMSNVRALALYQRIGFIYKYDLELNVGNGIETVRYLELQANIKA